MRELPGKNYTMKNKLDLIFPVVISSSRLKGEKGDSKISVGSTMLDSRSNGIFFSRGSKVV